MTSATQNSNRNILWGILIALGFLFGKTCNGGKQHTVPNEYRISYPVRTDTAVIIINPHEKIVIENKKQLPVYHRGPRGGCYYITESGNKVYVDRSICN